MIAFDRKNVQCLLLPGSGLWPQSNNIGVSGDLSPDFIIFVSRKCTVKKLFFSLLFFSIPRSNCQR